MNISLQRIYAVLFRNFSADKRSIIRVTDMIYYPAIDVCLWGLTSKWLQNGQTTNALIALGTALVLWQIVSRCILDITVGFVDELWNRSITNFFASPLSINEWIIANMLIGCIKLFFVLPYGTFLVWLIYGINVLSLGWSLTMYITILLFIGWSIGFFGASIILRWGRQAQSTPWMLAWFFMPICAVYYPVATLPPIMQKISLCMPITYVFEGVRHHISTGLISWHHIGTGVLLTCGYFMLSIFTFKRMFARALERGLASLE